jgi:Ca2+-binding RTX toxin-like protein
MTTRIRRALAAVTLTAASLTGTVALATPVWAADTVRVNLGNLIVSGDAANNNIRFTREASGAVVMTDTNAAVTAGTGCTQVNQNTVRCVGVQNLNVNGREGNDVIDNDTGSDGGNSNTGLPGTLNGGPGTDSLLGSTGRDELLGGTGAGDRANGGSGIDICNAEIETSCEE